MAKPTKLPDRLDGKFIFDWYSTYEITECDQNEYERLLECVAEELASGTMTWDTLFGIFNWKSKRIKGKLRGKGKLKKDQKVYLQAVAGCLLADEDARIALLEALPGIHIPTGSTILHFMYPDRFPISDVRTVEVLKYFNEPVRKTQSLNGYKLFRACLLRHQLANPEWSLRQLDMALFGFHKQNPQLFKKKT